MVDLAKTKAEVATYLRSLHAAPRPILLPPIEDDTSPGSLNRIGINKATGHPRVYRDGDHHLGYTHDGLKAGDVIEIEHGTGRMVKHEEATDD